MNGKRRLVGVAGVLALLALLALAEGAAQWPAKTPRTLRAQILAIAAALGPCVHAVAHTQALLASGSPSPKSAVARATGEQDRACRLASVRLKLTTDLWPSSQTDTGTRPCPDCQSPVWWAAWAGGSALDATDYARSLAGDDSWYHPPIFSDIEDDELWYQEAMWNFMSSAAHVLGSPAAAARRMGFACWTQGGYPGWSTDCRAPSTTGG